ncbi:hypothetical protein B0H17DRAFT_1046365 [Mycena rosella]|uniref:Secreted protein n=1 Tax=Mycena rosella TaxID=1033263 RepID=A0AAD7DVD9_MYCRO|nr:hypothetical protein B0H17DRAFT_1046365 [Mycena rosella]
MSWSLRQLASGCRIFSLVASVAPTLFPYTPDWTLTFSLFELNGIAATLRVRVHSESGNRQANCPRPISDSTSVSSSRCANEDAALKRLRPFFGPVLPKGLDSPKTATRRRIIMATI